MSNFLIITLAAFSKAKKEIAVTTAKDLEVAWNMGYDFKIVNGPYCSNIDIELMMEQGIEGVIIEAPDGSTKQINF